MDMYNKLIKTHKVACTLRGNGMAAAPPFCVSPGETRLTPWKEMEA